MFILRYPSVIPRSIEGRSGSRRLTRLFAGAVAAVGLVLAGAALATPDAATWRRQTLVGDNARHFFRYVASGEQPGTYYSYSRSLRLEKVRKADLRVMETFVLQNVTYSQDAQSERWSQVSAPVRPFDLSRYLRSNEVHIAFAEDLFLHRTFAIDSTGVWEVFEDGPIQIATRKELERQIPLLGEDPTVAGIESCGPESDTYLRIWSGSAGWDSDWSEDLLLVRRSVLR